jgi:hypothetical protein
MMNGCRKSDSCIVPTKSANKLPPEGSAEQMEGRQLVKVHADACSRYRTLRRTIPARGLNLARRFNAGSKRAEKHTSRSDD